MAKPSSEAIASPYSLPSFVEFITNNFAVIFLALLFFLGGFFVGSLWTENNILKNGGGAQVANDQGAGTVTAPTGPEGPTADQLKKAPKVDKDDYIRGNANAEIVLVEYSDFECPFCSRFHPTMQQVKKEYGDKVAWVFRYYPLPFHPNAQKAAEAAECIAQQKGQNGFWDYADKIYVKQEALGGKLSPEAITEVAQATGVNMDSFKKCLDSGEMAPRIKAQMDAGSTAGISGTPGTIIITKKGDYELIPGALPFEQVKPMLDKYLK